MPNKLSTSYGLEAAEGMGIRSINQTVLYSDFVDGGSTAGTMTLRKKLPAYCFPIGTKVQVVTGFTGSTNTTAVLQVGTSTTTLAAGAVDADILLADSSVDVFTAAKTYGKFATFLDADTFQGHTQTAPSNYILLTITMGGGVADWTAVTAGKLIIDVYYLSTVQQIA